MFKDYAKLDFLNNAVDSVASSIVSDNQFFTYSIYGGKPVALLIKQLSFDNMGTLLAFASSGFALLILLFLRSPKEKARVSQDNFQWESFMMILCSKPLWLLAVANLLLVGALEGFADVWGVSYLVSAYHLSQAEAAWSCYGFLLGWAV